MAENLKIPNEMLEPAILIKSLHDRSFFLKVQKYLDTRKFKNKSYFQDEKLQKIFNVISAWFEKYNKFPKKKELKILFDKMESDEEIKVLSENLIENVYTGDPNEIEEKFLFEEVKHFIEESRIYEAFLESQVDLKEGNFGSIVDRIKDAVSVNFDEDLGFSIREFARGLEQIEELNNELSIPSGLSQLDTILDGGFKSSEAYVFAATPGIGKTALLGNFAINNFLNDKKSLVYTLETHTRRLLTRFYANLLEMTKKELVIEKDEAFEKFDDMIKMTEGDLIIKDYNANTVNSNDLLAHINNLATYKEWIPDVIIVDYLLLMKTNDVRMSSDNSYKYYKTITEELRNLASTLNVPIITATQINRHGQDERGGTKQITTSKDISESRGIYDTADFFATINQTRKDREKEQILLYIDKWRNGQVGDKIRCEFNYEHMKIREV